MLTGPQAKMDPVVAAAVRQEVEEARRWYARATDLLGTGDSANVAEGTAIYHRIFTPKAAIRTTGGAVAGFEGTGPDEWADVVVGALEDYNFTQHLLGSQLAHVDAYATDDKGQVTLGHATLVSYLQAWHSKPDGHVWLFMGTYEDRMSYTAGVGWQIYDMTLREGRSDYRQLGEAPEDD